MSAFIAAVLAQSAAKSYVLGAVGALLGTALVLAVLLTVGRHRFKPREEQQRLFGARFDGRPAVYFAPWYWSLSKTDARAVARDHGYYEGPPVRRLLCFYRQPPGGGPICR
ncbi:MAG: hypothetical protein M3308_05675 [Actinomycetota bacterium]|nr:hypothetical protein [Actinomycetota bacterium]